MAYDIIDMSKTEMTFRDYVQGVVFERTEMSVYKLLNSISKKGSPRFRPRMVCL